MRSFTTSDDEKFSDASIEMTNRSVDLRSILIHPCLHRLQNPEIQDKYLHSISSVPLELLKIFMRIYLENDISCFFPSTPILNRVLRESNERNVFQLINAELRDTPETDERLIVALSLFFSIYPQKRALLNTRLLSQPDRDLVQRNFFQELFLYEYLTQQFSAFPFKMEHLTLRQQNALLDYVQSQEAFPPSKILTLLRLTPHANSTTQEKLTEQLLSLIPGMIEKCVYQFSIKEFLEILFQLPFTLSKELTALLKKTIEECWTLSLIKETIEAVKAFFIDHSSSNSPIISATLASLNKRLIHLESVLKTSSKQNVIHGLSTQVHDLTAGIIPPQALSQVNSDQQQTNLRSAHHRPPLPETSCQDYLDQCVAKYSNKPILFDSIAEATEDIYLCLALLKAQNLSLGTSDNAQYQANIIRLWNSVGLPLSEAFLYETQRQELYEEVIGQLPNKKVYFVQTLLSSDVRNKVYALALLEKEATLAEVTALPQDLCNMVMSY